MKALVCVFVFSCLAVFIDCVSVISHVWRRQIGQACSQDYIYDATRRCYGRLIDLTEVPNATDADLLNEVESMCRNVESAEECFEVEMRKCGVAGVTMARMMGNVFEFICGEGQSVLLSEGACWAHETLSEDMAQCTKIMEAGFGKQGYNGWCPLTKNYITCIGREITEKTVCSEAAAMFVQEMFRRSVQPVAEIMNCRLQQEEQEIS